MKEKMNSMAANEKVVFTRCHLQAKSRIRASVVALVRQLEAFRGMFTQGVRRGGEAPCDGRDAFGGNQMTLNEEEVAIRRLEGGAYELEYRCCLQGRVQPGEKDEDEYARQRTSAAALCFVQGLGKVVEPSGKFVVCVLL